MGTELSFKKGDKVRYIDFGDSLERGATYTVSRCEPGSGADATRREYDHVHLEEQHPSKFWWARRFEPVNDAPPALGPPGIDKAISAACNAFAPSRPAIDGSGVKGCMTSPKDPLELLDPDFNLGISKVLLKGAKKYAPHNWLRGMSWETVMGGVLRHLHAFRRGEELDPETGLPHLHHAACGIMFLSHYAHGPKASDYRKFDDRVFKQEETRC